MCVPETISKTVSQDSIFKQYFGSHFILRTSSALIASHCTVGIFSLGVWTIWDLLDQQHLPPCLPRQQTCHNDFLFLANLGFREYFGCLWLQIAKCLVISWFLSTLQSTEAHSIWDIILLAMAQIGEIRLHASYTPTEITHHVFQHHLKSRLMLSHFRTQLNHDQMEAAFLLLLTCYSVMIDLKIGLIFWKITWLEAI